jgi:hypothetical protein
MRIFTIFKILDQIDFKNSRPWLHKLFLLPTKKEVPYKQRTTAYSSNSLGRTTWTRIAFSMASGAGRVSANIRQLLLYANVGVNCHIARWNAIIYDLLIWDLLLGTIDTAYKLLIMNEL